MDQMNRSGPRRHKWTDWTESDDWTEVNQLG